MGNKRKQSGTRYRKFGVAGGSHGLKGKKCEKLTKKRLQQTLSTLDEKNEPPCMRIKTKKDLKFTFSRLCIERAKRYICKKSGEGTKLKFQAIDVNEMPGNRIINLRNLKEHVTSVSTHIALCEKARELTLQGTDPIVLVGEKRHGLHTILKVKCKGCLEEFAVSNSCKIECQKGELTEINVKGVWGSMVTGGGCSSINELMGTLGIPGLSPNEYTKIEEQIGEWWKSVLEEDMRDAVREEKENAIRNGSFHEGVPAVTVVCDGGWCKRSHKHTYNAMAGVGVIFGLHTKKLLHIGIRNKLCYICSAAETRNEKPRQHTCFKNWNDSAQSMESDIILEGFLDCEQVHGVRYMKIIADGDSSVYASIVANVAGWGASVKKLECANHACKCLRAHLEQLVIDKPYYKGKGKLTMVNRKRIVQGVRCAIKMRSAESDRTLAKKTLKKDIQNCGRHVLGLHDHCSTDFCKHAVLVEQTLQDPEEAENEEVESDEDGDAIKDASEMWEDTVKELSQKEVQALRSGGNKKVLVSEDLLRDVFFLLNRMADKSDRLICNFTSNLAESWMNIRCKFDGGKMTNRCFRGSFYARCYGGGLRCSRGPAWSPMVYAKVTGNRPDDVFLQTYRKRAQVYKSTVKRQRKAETKRLRSKRKVLAVKSNVDKKAKRSYGPKVLLDTADKPVQELQEEYDMYFKEYVRVTEPEIKAIEVETRGQTMNVKWKTERRKRLTSSVFGEVMSRSENNNRHFLTKRLLYTNFEGNIYTRKGLMEEENARKEYKNIKNRNEEVVSHIIVPGLCVCSNQPYLATSSDGIVHLKDGTEGLIEIKHLLQNREYNIQEAVKKEKNFCLVMQSGEISLKRNHKYFYQIQGQLNIMNKEWCDLVIRRTDPYDIYVERIAIDTDLWCTRMLPKLKAFYFTHLLPELAVPRHGTVSGIRKPSIPWYSQQTDKRNKGQQQSRPHSEKSLSLPETSASPSVSTAVNTCTTKSTEQSQEIKPPTKSGRARKLKFVGRRIRHKWEADGTDNWYNGVVLGLSSGTDGHSAAVYQIQYDDDNEVYDVDDLMTDYVEGNLQFADL